MPQKRTETKKKSPFFHKTEKATTSPPEIARKGPDVESTAPWARLNSAAPRRPFAKCRLASSKSRWPPAQTRPAARDPPVQNPTAVARPSLSAAASADVFFRTQSPCLPKWRSGPDAGPPLLQRHEKAEAIILFYKSGSKNGGKSKGASSFLRIQRNDPTPIVPKSEQKCKPNSGAGIESKGAIPLFASIPVSKLLVCCKTHASHGHIPQTSHSLTSSTPHMASLGRRSDHVRHRLRPSFSRHLFSAQL